MGLTHVTAKIINLTKSKEGYGELFLIDTGAISKSLYFFWINLCLLLSLLFAILHHDIFHERTVG